MKQKTLVLYGDTPYEIVEQMKKIPGIVCFQVLECPGSYIAIVVTQIPYESAFDLIRGET